MLHFGGEAVAEPANAADDRDSQEANHAQYQFDKDSRPQAFQMLAGRSGCTFYRTAMVTLGLVCPETEITTGVWSLAGTSAGTVTFT